MLLLPSEQFDAWGWRLPFLAAFPLLLIALYIRLKVEESPIFRELVKLEERAKIPAVDVFKQAWGRLLVAIAAAFLGVGGFYIMTTFVISYGADTLGLDRGLMVNATLVAVVVQIFVVLALGYNLAGALSGFLPLIAVALLGVSDGGSWTAALLLIVVSLITAVGGFHGERLRVKDKAIVR